MIFNFLVPEASEGTLGKGAGEMEFPVVTSLGET